MFSINKFLVGGSNPCFIIAEIGQNHNGDMEIAKRMIHAANECGVSCVKFQKSSLKDRFNKAALEAPYDSDNSFGDTYGEHRAYLEFSEEEFVELKRYAEEEVGVMFAASCMDIPSADFLYKLGVPFLKIGSGDTNNPLLIEHVAKLNIPIFLSTGMSDMETVEKAYKMIKQYHSNFALMHCVSAYPTIPEDVNLSVIQRFKATFPEIPIGYSGHEQGIVISIAAVACGAKIIEKHFTLDKSMKGTDHKCSLDPVELFQLVDSIREVESAMGNSVKLFMPCEKPCSEKLGKTLVAAKRIEKGTVIQRTDIAVKVAQPRGIEPKYFDFVVGRQVSKVIEEDTPITRDAFLNIDSLHTEL